MKITDVTHPLYFSILPQGETVTPRAHGIDISKYDQYFLPETATSQLDFVIQRISYRKTRDEAFLKLLPGVMQVGIRGGYHYLNSDTPWKVQADAYLSFIQGYNYHFHVGDLEAAFNVMNVDFAYQGWQWIQYVQDRTGKPCLYYTSPSLYSQYLYPSQKKYGIDWNKLDGWSAQWFFTPNPNGTPSNPTGRTRGWKFWQYTDKGDGTKYGVARPTACDLNVFNGTKVQLMQWLGITDQEPGDDEPIPDEEEPTTGGSTVTTYYLTATGNPTKVFADSTMNKDVNKIPNGTPITSTIKGTLGYYISGYGWVKFSQVKLDREVKDEVPTDPGTPAPGKTPFTLKVSGKKQFNGELEDE